MIIKQLVVLFVFFLPVAFAYPQDPASLIIGKWINIKDSITERRLFDSEYIFEFRNDGSFKIHKPVEGKDYFAEDETGVYELANDSVQVTITKENGQSLLYPQSISFKLIRLSETELLLQWPELIRINNTETYPVLNFGRSGY